MSDPSRAHNWRLLFITTATKLADLLISPKTTLPWLFTTLGTPGWLMPLLVPVKESGSLLPQWSVKHYFSHAIARRTVVWRVGALIQASSAIFLVLASLWLTGINLAIAALLLLGLFSLGRSFCSLTMKDIQAELIEKGQRGKFVGGAASASGGLTLLLVVALHFSGNQVSVVVTQWLIVAAGLLFGLALILSLPLKVKVDQENSKESKYSLIKLLKENGLLRKLITSRVLLMHGGMVFPFITAESAVSDSFLLPYLIGVTALASLLSSRVWGTFSDTKANRTLFYAAILCAIATLLSYLLAEDANQYLVVGLFFLLSIGYAGVRTSRKTYLLDITDTSERAAFVAAANTTIGTVLLASGGFYAWLYQLIGQQVVLIMLFMLCAGALHTFILPDEK